MRTENFSFVVKDIRITHLVSTRSKKISHSCLVPNRSRSLCGEIWVNYEGKQGDHFPLARQARSARGGWWERAQSAHAKCLQLSRVSLVSALALLACSVTKPHESPWVGEGGGGRGGRSHSPFQNSLLLMCALIPHPFDPYMTSILYLPHWTSCFLAHLKVNWFSLFLFNGVAVTHPVNKTSAEGTFLFQVLLSAGLIDAILCSGIQSFVALSTTKAYMFPLYRITGELLCRHENHTR